MTVTDRGASTWFRYAGWRLELDRRIEWNLDLAGDVAGDVSAYPGVAHSGWKRQPALGAVAAYALKRDGRSRDQSSERSGVNVSGVVQPPSNWDGNTSPGGGNGWMISVSEGVPDHQPALSTLARGRRKGALPGESHEAMIENPERSSSVCVPGMEHHPG